MSAIRSSYGLLGVIVEATLRVQPVSTFSASHRKLTVDEFCSVVDTLSNNDGFKFYLMPYRDRVYLDLRRYAESARNAYRTPWKIKDWGESTVLPNVCKSLNRLLPIHSVRYRLIDSVSEATQGIVNGPFVNTGNNTIVGQTGRNFSRTRNMLYSTWCFPASDFSVVAKAYQDFCRQSYAKSRYRCDMPAVGYRICRDRSSVLSPAFDEPMIRLCQANLWPSARLFSPGSAPARSRRPLADAFHGAVFPVNRASRYTKKATAPRNAARLYAKTLF